MSTVFSPLTDRRPEFPADFESTLRGDAKRGAKLARTPAGVWWWIGADGIPAVVRGVQGVDATVGSESADHQVKRWGFNVLVPPVAPAFARRGATHWHALNLNQAGARRVHEEGLLLPDVFDSAWEEAVEQILNGVPPVAGLEAWVMDSACRWGGWAEAGESLSRPALLQVCLGLDPAYRAYHSAWEFVLARHGGELAQVAQDWGLPLVGRGGVRQWTREEHLLDTPGYRVDADGFLQEFAQRYFAGVRSASRRVNPAMLLVSPPLAETTPPPVRALAASQCDLLVVRERELVKPDAPQLLLIDDWADAGAAVDPTTGESGLERRIRQGRESLIGALTDPRIVGYGWGSFRRGDLAVDDPFRAGLVDDHGRCNELLVQPLAALNTVATALRAQTPFPSPT